jgi:hypothetical protein
MFVGNIMATNYKTTMEAESQRKENENYLKKFTASIKLKGLKLSGELSFENKKKGLPKNKQPSSFHFRN